MCALQISDWLIAASMAGLFPTHQPPGNLPDVRSQNRYLLRNLELRNYRVRVARIEDLPALTLMEERCWAKALRTPEAVLKRRIARYPQGQCEIEKATGREGVCQYG